MRNRTAIAAERPVAVVLLALSTLADIPGAHAEAISRGDAMARVMQHNPQVAAAAAAVAQAQARKGQARAARFPSINVTVGAGPSLQAELVPGTAVQSTESTYGDVGLDDLSIAVGGQLQVIQPLYTFGKIGQRAEAARHEIRARKAQKEMTRADVGVEVAELYEGLLFARDAERFFAETYHWLSRAVEDTQRELEAGTGPTEQDLLRLQAALGVVSMGLNQAEAAHRQAEAGLVAYLGLNTGATLEPREPGLDLLPTPPDNAEQMIAMALEKRPELRALSEGSAAYEALAHAEEAGNLPDLFAMAFLFGGYTPGRDLIQTRYVQDPLNGFYPGVLVGARWQLTGAMASRRADEKQAMARELLHTRRWALSGMPAEVTRAFQNVQRARKDADVSEKAVKAAKAWMVQASADYSVGLGDSRDVTDAAEAYVQLRIAHFDAKFRHNVALAELARATGTLAVPPSPFYPIQKSPNDGAQDREQTEPSR